MTTELTPWQMLREPFPPGMVGKLPKGGIMLDYVGHAAVTDRLLQVDPTWTWEPLALSPDGLPALDRAGNLWIRLTINGVTRIGVGDGKNAKECISDAIRNAAMRFGVALDLWAKEDLHAKEPASAKPPPARAKPPSEGAVKKMHALFNEKGITDRGDRLRFTVKTINRAVETSTDLTSTEVALVSRTLAALDPAPKPPDAEQAGPVTADTAASEPGPAEPYTQKREKTPATQAQLERLDELVTDAMETRFATVHDLWVQVAAYRKVQLADLIDVLDGADPGRPGLLWAPLRDSLHRHEAGDLIDHLMRARRDAGLPEQEIPF